MNRDVDVDKLKGRKLCFNCVGESFLRDEIHNQGARAICSYCGKSTESYSIEQMSERIETVFEQHYIRTSDQPSALQYSMLTDKESNYDWERDGEPVVDAIMNAADIPQKAASDIQRILEDKFFDFESATMSEETDFSSDSFYEESDTNDERWQNEWRDFEHYLKTEARFFSRTAGRLLTSVFEGIDRMRTRDDRSLIIDAGPNTEFSSVFRARSFQSDDALKNAIAHPDDHLGSPLSAHARAGRMNAHGISVFYGANDPMVALAEVRPPVGSKVVVGRFEIVRPIRLLDLTALNDVTTSGSIFDPTFIGRLERTMFLRNLSQRITVPVMPDDEPFEYLATQAIADFLATENTPPLDGIIFPSVQTAGRSLNVVLFHKAARVEEMEVPEGTKISSSLGYLSEDGWEGDYSVFEEVPPKKEDVEKKKRLGFGPLLVSAVSWDRLALDTRPPTLKIDLESVRVHIVEAVAFKTIENLVHRHRVNKSESDL